VSEAVEKQSKGNMGEFVQGVREEMRRTTFPSGDEVRKTTIIVVVNVIFFALYLFLIDRAWVYVLDALAWVVNKMAGA